MDSLTGKIVTRYLKKTELCPLCGCTIMVPRCAAVPMSLAAKLNTLSPAKLLPLAAVADHIRTLHLTQESTT